MKDTKDMNIYQTQFTNIKICEGKNINSSKTTSRKRDNVVVLKFESISSEY